MANDKDIKLGIVTTADTSGAKQAEAALNKVAEASKDVAQAEATGFGRDTAAAKRIAALEAMEAGMQKVEVAAVELKQGLEQITEEVKDIEQATEQANEQGGELDENVRKITRAERGRALADLANHVGLIGQKFKEVAAEMEEFDAEAARSLRDTGENIEKTTTAISQLALGFAVGGPLGAGLAGITILVTDLMALFGEMELAAAQAAAREKQARLEVEQQIRTTAAAERERQAEMESGAVLRALAEELSALEKITNERRIQSGLAREKRRLENEVLQAEDQARLAEIDEAQATGKLTAPEAEAQRAEIEASARKRARETRKEDAQADAKQAEDEAKDAEEIALQKRAAANQFARKQAEEAARLRELQKEGESAAITFDPNNPVSVKRAEDNLADRASSRKILEGLNKKREEAEAAARAAEEANATAARDAEAKRESAGAVVSAVDLAGAAQERGIGARRRAQEAREAERLRVQRERDDAKAARERDRDIPRRADLAGEEGAAVGRTDTALEGSRGSRFFPPVEKARKALEDGATGDEYKQLGAELESFVAALTNIDAKKKADISALARQFRDLGERVKRLENQ